MNNANEVIDWLHSRPGKVRLMGSGSRSKSLPAKRSATLLDLSQMNQIVRLDPGDQTCTVECGVPRADLDAALHEHSLELSCLGGGTIGGLFASDPLGPAAAGCQGPRNLLLGAEAILSDGTAFRSGSRVVKSVAGFDVHKLLVGSHGRLFVATQLHLRLKPRPRAEQWFCNAALCLEEALSLLHALRAEEQPPTVLQLKRIQDGSYSVGGRVTGRSVHVNALKQRHGLKACEQITTFHVEADIPNGEEVLSGQALPSALRNVLGALPENAPFTWLGGGRFEAVLQDTRATDSAIERMPTTPASATVLLGHDNRRGRSTPLDQGEQHLAEGLKQALDPDGILV